MEPEGREPRTAVEHVLKTSQHKRNTGYVLIKLAQCIDTGNDCPSHKDLADMTGLAKSTVQHALGDLEKDGTIIRTTNGGKKVRGGKTNCYRLAGMTPETVPQESKPVKSVPVESIPDETIPPESMLSYQHTEYAPAHVHAGSDAAGEKDLSLRAKAKSKKITPLTPQGDAPDGASVVPSKPKRERKQPPIVLHDDDYQRLRRGVALRSWGIDPDNPAMREMLGKSDFARIGKIVSWLQAIKASPEKLSEFYGWYKQQYPNASAPKDFEKFKEHFAAFVQAKTQPIISISANPAYAPVQDRPRLRADEIVDLDNYTPELIR